MINTTISCWKQHTLISHLPKSEEGIGTSSSSVEVVITVKVPPGVPLGESANTSEEIETDLSTVELVEKLE